MSILRSLATLCLCLGSIFIFAQNDVQPLDPGTATGKGSLVFHEARITETIDPYSGNLHLEIPLVTLKGRAHDSRLRMIYNSHFWVGRYNKQLDENVPVCDPELYQNPSLGWATTAAESGGLTNNYHTFIYQTDTSGNPPVTFYHEYIDFIDVENNKIALTGVNNEASSTGLTNTKYLSSGSEFIEADSISGGTGVAANVHYKHGTTVLFGGHTVDTNGNYLDVDTLGRVFTTTIQPDGSQTITYKTDDGNTATITFQFTTYTVNCVGTSSNNSDTRPLLTAVILPSGETYTLQYAYTNELSKIGLPGGGYLRYEYDLGGSHSLDSNGSRGTVSKRAVSEDGIHELSWTFSYPYSGPTTTVTRPDGTKRVFTFYGGNGNNSKSLVTQVQFEDSTGAVLKTINNGYQFSGTCDPTYDFCDKDPVLTTTTTTLDTGLVSKTTFGYDAYANVNSATQFDYGNGAPGGKLKSYSYAYKNTSPYISAHILDRPTDEYIYNSSGTQIAHTQVDYDNTTISSTSSAPAHDYTGYSSSNTTRGNATRIRKWLNTTNAFLPDYVRLYNDLGGVIQETDPNNHSTSYSYTDSWADTTCAPATNSYAFATTTTNALSQQSKDSFFSCLGAVQASRNPNDISQNRTGTTFTYDNMGRQLSVSYPDGGSSSFSYNDTSKPLSSSSSVKRDTAGDTVDTSIILDGLGRKSQTRVTSDPGGAILTDFEYDSLGRLSSVSNPYRSTSEPTYGTTTYAYDALDRKTDEFPADNSTKSGSDEIHNAYSGNTTTVTDEAGLTRETVVNALGLLTSVFENPSKVGGASTYETDYYYDGLGNLYCVQQKGTASSGTVCPSAPGITNPFSNVASNNYRGRWFVYDSLSRLTDAYNPESGHTQWTYDNNSNVLTKTDARGITINYSPTSHPIDALNRVQSKTYSDSTPAVIYYYDGSTPYSGYSVSGAVGYRTGMSDGSGMTAWQFDSMGRVTLEKRTINGVLNQIATAYTPMGLPSAITYPTGTIVNLTYDGSGRIAEISDGSRSGVSYLRGLTDTTYSSLCPAPTTSGVSYTAAGAPTLYEAGYQSANPTNAGIIVNNCFNSRLQPTSIIAQPVTSSLTYHNLYLTYSWNEGVADNGDLMQVKNGINGNLSKNFYYDAYNRIVEYQTPNTKTYDTKYVMDAWGNLTNKNQQSGSLGENLQTGGANNANQLASYQYDGGTPSAGNITYDGLNHYGYDAENRLASITGGPTYLYDGDGERVQKSSGETYWGGGAGHALVESDSSGNATGEYIYFLGRVIARRDLPGGNLYYYFGDSLGSSTAITDPTGVGKDAYDYAPFGELHWSSGAGPNTHYLFTGKERDSTTGETGLDYFGARYYASSMGRFMTSDWSETPTPVPYAKLGFPQTLNLYSYVRNNPTTDLDPDGHGFWTKLGNWLGDAGCWCEGEKAKKAREKRKEEEAEIEREMQEAARDPRAQGAVFALFLMVDPLVNIGGGASEAQSAVASELDEEGAWVSGILREAASSKGNTGLGEAVTEQQAELIGKAWVGPDAHLASDGVTWESADKLRTYRPPTFKPNLGKVQANLEQKLQPGSTNITNYHLTIK